MENAQSVMQSPAFFSSTLPDNGITAKSQMAYQEYLSNTAYQRAMADMKAAGLNPVLAGHNGGASSPSGSQDSAETIALLNSITDLVHESHGGNGRSQLSGAQKSDVRDAARYLSDAFQDAFTTAFFHSQGKYTPEEYKKLSLEKLKDVDAFVNLLSWIPGVGRYATKIWGTAKKQYKLGAYDMFQNRWRSNSAQKAYESYLRDQGKSYRGY